MVKKTSSSERIKKQAALDRELFMHDELVAAICKYFCRGMTVAEIRKEIESKFGRTLKREEPYRLIAFAAKKGWLRYIAPLTHTLAEKIRSQYPWLTKVTVVRTSVSDDVSYHVADMLKDEVCSIARESAADAEVHIGFAGGGALRKTARIFSDILREPREDLPREIVFHAMVAGFNMKDPSMDPNGFFTYFAGDPSLQVKTSFLGLLAPGIVKTSEIEKLRSIQYIQDAYDRAKEIDIIVTGAGGHWKEGHSSLYSLCSRWAPQSLKQITNAGCIGDMLWCPIGKDGPLEIKTHMRAVTLMELKDLAAFINEGKKVILLFGPCGNCGEPKSEVLRSILNSKQKLITHLVVDTRSARGIVNQTEIS